MSWSLSAWALTMAVTVFATAAPALGGGGGYQGALVRSGAAAASAARGSPVPLAPNIVTRPMPPFQRAPGMGVHGHHHGPVVIFVQPPFFGTQYFGYSFSPYYPYYPYSPSALYPYSSPYPYSSLYPYSSSPSYLYSWLYSFGTPRTYADAGSTSTAPYYCWVDGIGFTDEGRFLHHLHEVHGVPLDEALAATEVVGERRVFYGY